ncbi:hypothetical protein XENOCAPTIV_013242 [Xenoophorus captivus]|uniref:Uncharacterized protein n=1 Tax=Xenoophorus captivus TaxID=1517983 RepID=A0ABV0SHG6_9TELE
MSWLGPWKFCRTVAQVYLLISQVISPGQTAAQNQIETEPQGLAEAEPQRPSCPRHPNSRLFSRAQIRSALPGFKLKHFLRDNETLSSFLQRNTSLSQHGVQQITEADINLEKVLLRGFGVHLKDMCPRKGGTNTLGDFVTISDQQVASLRDVRSDPEAVQQVARATNNLLDSLGSLAVEVRLLICHSLFSQHVQRNIVMQLDRRQGQWVYLAALGVPASLCVQMKAAEMDELTAEQRLECLSRFLVS